MIALGNIPTFKEPLADKNQAVKVLEEAAEVFGAWQDYDQQETEHSAYRLKKECADVIMATCNLLAAIGVKDFTGFMEDCVIDNIYRGRVYEGLEPKKIIEAPKGQLCLI